MAFDPIERAAAKPKEPNLGSIDFLNGQPSRLPEARALWQSQDTSGKQPSDQLVALGFLPDTGLLATDKSQVDSTKEVSPVKRFFDISQANEVFKVNGKEELRPLKVSEQLSAGDHLVRFKNGREFLVHVPPLTEKERNKLLPLTILIPGVSNTFQNPKGYVAEAHLNEEVDKGQQKSIVVTLLTEKHKIGKSSTTEAWAWNLPGAGIHQEDVKAHAQKVGYDDRHYFAGVLDVVSQFQNVNPDRRTMAVLAGSQGALAWNRSFSDPEFRALMKETVPIFQAVGGSMEEGDEKYKVAPYDIPKGSRLWITIVDTQGDDRVLPHRWDPVTFESTKRLARMVGLMDVDNQHQDPDKQRRVYLRNLGSSGEYVLKAYVASNPGKKLKTREDFDKPLTEKEAKEEEAKIRDGKASRDVVLTYRIKGDPEGLKGSLDIIGLAKASHVIPGPREGSTSMVGNKYEGFFTGRDALQKQAWIIKMIQEGKIKRDLQP